MNAKYEKFSERAGITQPKPVQRDDMDMGLRNGLWSLFFNEFISNGFSNIYEIIWQYFFKEPIDEYDNHVSSGQVKSLFLTGKYDEVFDLIEFIIQYQCYVFPTTSKLEEKFNLILGNENSAYRICAGLFTEITSEIEIEEIENAMKVPYSSVKNHIQKSHARLFDRNNPDYQNSIKESISAVESIAREITGNHNGTLGELADKLPMQHNAFKNSIKTLYGFTSDANGIRHGGSGEPLNVDKNTARFMLILCSAFVNYIISNEIQETNHANR